MSRLNDPLPPLSRYAIAFGTAAVVASLAYLCAWYDYRGFYNYRYGHQHTRYELEMLRDDIEQYRNANGALPASLSDLPVVRAGRFLTDEAGRPRDYWSGLIHYHVDGNRFDLYSLGRDKAPGGIGWDSDIHVDDEPDQTEYPTLWQFANAPGSEGMQATCAVAGLIAFAICLLCGRASRGGQPSLKGILVANAITAVFCVIAAFVISALHLPTGH